MTVFYMQMKDACAKGDGERNNINLNKYFKSHSSFTKYAIENEVGRICELGWWKGKKH